MILGMSLFFIFLVDRMELLEFCIFLISIEIGIDALVGWE